MPRAILYWCMEIVAQRQSLESCYGKNELFRVMFPSETSKNFSLSPKKASYIITEALSPYFKNIMLDDLKHPDILYSLIFDETSNVKSVKELQIKLRFWSTSENKILCRHLHTFFIGSATGEILYQRLEEALNSNNLPLKKVMTICRDGPNVNKTLFALFQESLKKLNLKPLIDLGSCNIHIVHNAFLKGCEKLGLDVSDFIIQVYYYFHHHDVRCENFSKIQVDKQIAQHVFIVHICSRWLTLGPAAERAEEQLPVLLEYFLKYVPRNDPETIKKKNYCAIREYLNNNSLKTYLQFIQYIAKIFTVEFTLLMQKEEPLIHILYSQLKKLIIILLSNFIKASVLESITFTKENIRKILKDSNSFMELSKIIVGERTKKSLASLPELTKASFLLEAKNFYVASVNHILDKINCFSTLRYFECLDPVKIKNPNSCSYILKIADLLPLTIDKEKLECEWKLLTQDEKIVFRLQTKERIDTYWNNIFQIQSNVDNTIPMYAEVKRVVQNALALTHGNSDVERGFSTSGDILTSERNRMCEKMLNAQLHINEGLKKYDYMVYKVPITPELLKLSRGAHASYLLYIEAEKMKKQKEEEKRLIDAKIKAEEEERKKLEKEVLEKREKEIKLLKKELEKLKNEHKMAHNDADSMQKALLNAIKSNSKSIVTKEMGSSLEKLRKHEAEKLKEVDNLQIKINKLITIKKNDNN